MSVIADAQCTGHDHGVLCDTWSLTAADHFEIAWMIPTEHWSALRQIRLDAPVGHAWRQVCDTPIGSLNIRRGPDIWLPPLPAFAVSIPSLVTQLASMIRSWRLTAPAAGTTATIADDDDWFRLSFTVIDNQIRISAAHIVTTPFEVPLDAALAGLLRFVHAVTSAFEQRAPWALTLPETRTLRLLTGYAEKDGYE